MNEDKDKNTGFCESNEVQPFEHLITAKLKKMKLSPTFESALKAVDDMNEGEA